MIATDFNPFRPTRWEFQNIRNNVIWFAPTAEGIRRSEKPVYLRGSRGSGKTSLLKSLCWNDLIENQSLRSQVNLEDFQHIGIYIKLPHHIGSSLKLSFFEPGAESRIESQLQFHSYFSLVIELLCIEKVLESCHELRIRQKLRIKTKSEIKLVNDFILEFQNFTTHFAKGNFSSFQELARFLRNIIRELVGFSPKESVHNIRFRLPNREPGEMLRFVTERLSKSISYFGKNEFSSLGFRFCLDDCEVLNYEQQLSLNTLVRTCTHPITWVISSVGPYFETTLTYTYPQPLTEHDRKIVKLDEADIHYFRKLCQSVISLRLYFSISENARAFYSGKPEDFFNLEMRLGKLGINDIFQKLISRSKSALAVELLESAIVVSSTDFHILPESIDTGGMDNSSIDLPLFETYLLMVKAEAAYYMTWDPKTALENKNKIIQTRNENGVAVWLRKRQVSALLHFCDRLKVKKIPLAGKNIVTTLADGSIRDFLEIMGDIFDSQQSTIVNAEDQITIIEKFARSGSKISDNQQTDGIYKSSEGFLDSVSKRSEIDVNIVSRFVEGIGKLTKMLQSNSDDISTINTPERGIFAVRFSRDYSETSDAKLLDEFEDEVRRVIIQSELAGYVRQSDIKYGSAASKFFGEKKFKTINFRLHKRFAPYFGYSFRGAYEPVLLEVRELYELLRLDSKHTTDSWAARVASTIDNTATLVNSQLKFEFDKNDD